MAHLGFSYPDKPYDSFWGPPNSHHNFCEEDFILTPFIAEVINTLTNLTYLLYGSYGIYKNRHKPDAFLHSWPYIGIMSVGLGSAIFHATNLYYTQWADDLSMLFATATVMHRVYTFDKPLKDAVVWGLGLAGFLFAFSVYHCMTDEIVMHAILFGVMILAVGIKTRATINARITSPILRSQIRKLVWVGTGSFGLGWALWNVDQFGCDTLTSIKRWIGMPLSFIFELHGWWHIFTGIGAYCFIGLVEYLTSEEAGEELKGRFAWPVGKFVGGEGKGQDGVRRGEYEGLAAEEARED